MSTVPGAPASEESRRARRSAASTEPAEASATPTRRARAAKPKPPTDDAARPARSRSTKGKRPKNWFGWLSLVIPVVALPLSFFVWFSIIELGSYPGEQATSDFIVGALTVALFHAALLAGILFGVLSIRALRRVSRISLTGWAGVVLGALVVVYWQLLVSPWLVDLWERMTA